MPRRLLLLPILALLALIPALAACTGAELPTAAAAQNSTPLPPTNTPSPTVSLPTPKPPTATPAPPTKTPTKVVKTPTPQATATSTTTSTPEPETYTVKEGDTLLGIAVQFDTTTTEIAAANGISEDDFLQLGQELVIPAPTATPTPIGAKAAVSPQNPITTTLITSTTSTTAADSVTAPPPPDTPTPSGPPLPVITHPDNINPLTGLPVADPSVLKRRPLMVRIGNDVGARPQRGLNEADIVYEEITEWWITRFSAIYLSQTPEIVGPVRSVRLVNVQLAPQYGAALAHSGGSDPVRWEVSQAPITNLDQFYNAEPYEHLPNEGWQTRAIFKPQVARAYMQKKGLEAAVPLQGFLFSDSIDTGEPGENIWIYYPRSTSFTEWHYDAASGKYLRWIIGSPLMDAIDGKQISASNVIVYFAEHQDTDIVEDSNGATSVRIIVNGKGTAWFFRDGKLNKGFWQTDGTRTPYFTLENGQPYNMKPGNTWVEVVPTSYKIGLNSAEEASTK